MRQHQISIVNLGLYSQTTRRLSLRSNYLLVRFLVRSSSFIFVVVIYLAILIGFTSFYDLHYGYTIGPDEAPGPLGDRSSGDWIAIPLLFFGGLSLLIQAIVLAMQGLVGFVERASSVDPNSKDQNPNITLTNPPQSFS